ncbi:MAG: DUF1460 domain-containing protein [Proteiniphilum sp.]|jgi:hypothetical protein|nr:DUF1460 domain-containing protein [Proteiniphilum sp.]
MKLISVIVCVLLAAGMISAQPKAYFTPEDLQIFNQYLSYIKPFKNLTKTEVLEKTAIFFLGKPYESHTLETTAGETLVVNLRAFDCTTFVETVIALSRTASSVVPSFNTYLTELQNIRYRNGAIDGYASRLHYTTDWVYENERNGKVKNISAALGGIVEMKTIGFMSAHRESYRQLKGEDATLQEIVDREKVINGRGGFAFLPKTTIAIAAPLIPHMAMIGFTTDIRGLDVSHTGFTFHDGEKLTFIHASSARQRVVIDQKTLSDYCLGQKSCTGILVSQIM